MDFSRSRAVARSFYLVLLSVLVTACQPSSGGGGEAPPRPQTAEKPYSATPTVYSGLTTTITTTATFDRYNDSAGGLIAISNNPIRYAEFHILDANGTQIQQGETNASGGISAIIPRVAGNYTISVNSRADNVYYKVSVLDNPYDQNYYSAKATFTLNGSETSSNVTFTAAPATNTSTLEGGAFNILDQIFIANEFLRTRGNEAGCSVCTNDFTVAPKIPIYWTKGITPGTYYGASNTAISFFLNQTSGSVYRGIYILGGLQGSVCTDTDHFDRSVILHEYGHYLESAYSKSASPGGSHNGDDVIDPRLAWSEGWANFFQALALGRTVYRDTVKNSACTGGASLAFNDFNMETKAAKDVPVNGTNEGIFREISISRMLYDNATGTGLASDVYGSDQDSDGRFANTGFAIVWHTFKAMGSSTYKFQNAGIFNELMTGFIASAYPARVASHSSLLSHEEQINNQTLYGRKLTPQALSCDFSIPGNSSTSPTVEEISNGVITYSDNLRNNDFFRYDYDGNPANGNLILRYVHTTGTYGSVPYDLDFFAYREQYTFLDSGDLVSYSTGAYPESGGTGYETINLSGQPAATYMINVKVDYTAVRDTTQYYIEVPNAGSGVRLCP